MNNAGANSPRLAPKGTARTWGTTQRQRALGIAWIGLSLALAVHVFDEATTGFLNVYNPTVLEARARFGWFPMPTFTFGAWLGGLIFAVVVLLAVSPLVFRGVRGMRPLAYVFAIMMMLNAAGHTLGTIRGQTFADIQFARPMPGFYSSPLLLAASVFLIVRLRRTRRQSQATIAQSASSLSG